MNKRGCGGPAPAHMGNKAPCRRAAASGGRGGGTPGQARGAPREERLRDSACNPLSLLVLLPLPSPHPGCLFFPFHCFQFSAQIILAYSRQSQSVWQNKKLKQAILRRPFKDLSGAQKEVHQCWNASGNPDPFGTAIPLSLSPPEEFHTLRE